MNPNHGNEDHKKQAALHHACMGGSVDSVRILLKYGADVNQPDKVIDTSQALFLYWLLELL